jgi:multidrug efflux pump subunit AcrA (membrane-fusion protein)
MPHELRLGQRGEGYVQVLEGLEPGHRVVTSAQFLLDSESNLAEVMRAMMAQMGGD